jgi:murein DD-endopeptidase MepM/ murein hydrolase activator NlpD
MGDTGRATGPNLHFEVLHEGKQVNPVTFIRQGAE